MPDRYTFLDLDIDLEKRLVRRACCTLEVTGLSFDLLACLVVRGDAVVSFDELMAAVWAPAVVNDETVTQRIKLLRQALGDDSRKPRYIRSVRGRGYQLMAKPRAVTGSSDAACAPADVVPIPLRVRRTIRKPFLLSAGVAVVLVGAAIWLVLAHRPVTAPDSDLLERARYYASIGQKDNNERAIGLYEKALRETPAQAGAMLGLSFAYSARVCLYDFPGEWLDRAESLARGVLQTEPRNALAYKALGYAADCRGHIDSAIAAYEHALRLDPGSRQDSLASVANLYQVKGRLVEALRSDLALKRKNLPLRYVDIQTARTLELLGFTAQAERLYARSFRLYPDNVFSNVAWPQFLMTHGRLLEASAALGEALGRGTDRYDLQLLAAELALRRGDRRAAAESFERACAMRPRSSFPRTMALIHAEQLPHPESFRKRIDAVQRSIDAGDRWPVNWLEIAVLENALGDRPAAIAALGRAVDAGFLDKVYLESSPFFQPLHSEAGFVRIVAIMTRRVDEQRRVVLDSDWAPREMMFASR
jgi:DNA-binding winged helix-turn-helix (wHTH) protein/tetratricopeptide (TPR) repeat protein